MPISNFQHVEKLKNDLLRELPYLFGRTKLFRIIEFYDSVFSTEDQQVIEAYTCDFIEEYIAEVFNYTPFYSAPAFSHKLLIQLNNLINVTTLDYYIDIIEKLIQSTNLKLQKLDSILEGNAAMNSSTGFMFPLLEALGGSNAYSSFGTIESVNIKIHKTNNQNRFLFVPSAKIIEERLFSQAKISFEFALNYFSKHKKTFNGFHEVLIYFDNLSANYEGNSLGVALTIGIINQLSQNYNLPYITNIKCKVASTGGVDQNGIVKSVGKEAIAKKVEIVFYSEFDTLIIPKDDEQFARDKLRELKLLYPQRKLKLVAVADMEELLNRRDLVEIRKQNKIVRTAKRIRKNWISSLLIILLFVGFAFVYVREYDDNPYLVEIAGEHYIIKNKKGMVLWKKPSMAFSSLVTSSTNLEILAKVTDINDDGTNEVLITGENFKGELARGNDGISCYNKKGDLIWKYIFNDDVSSQRDTLNTDYGYPFIIDIVKKNNSKVLYLSVRHGPSFASAIFTLDLLTGKRVGNTLWNSGHIHLGIIRDIDSTGKQELIYTFNNNGMKRSGIAVIGIDDAKGQGPTSKNYSLTGISIAKFKAYILVPQTDFSIYSGNRRGSILPLELAVKQSDKKIYFSSVEEKKWDGRGLNYTLSFNLKDINVVPDDNFVVMRDELVRKKILNPPYTDTKEYMDLIKSQILYWNGKEFIPRKK
ncbi:MAG: hypothetical protein KF816_02135 [Melioribacteraceae bacterium]|nr:hypothetical protein [Melioribacteraceae bacterium]